MSRRTSGIVIFVDFAWRLASQKTTSRRARPSTSFDSSRRRLRAAKFASLKKFAVDRRLRARRRARRSQPQHRSETRPRARCLQTARLQKFDCADAIRDCARERSVDANAQAANAAAAAARDDARASRRGHRRAQEEPTAKSRQEN